MNFIDFCSCEASPTPRTAFTRIRNIDKTTIENGFYGNHPNCIKNEKKGLMVNEFLVYWPIVCGHLSAKSNAGKFSKCLKGTSQKTLSSIS